MARPGKETRLRYVEPHRGRDGVTRYYFRQGKGARTALPGKPGDPEFMLAYARALAAATGKTLPPSMQPPTLPVVPRPAGGTISAALQRYYQSQAWCDLAVTSRECRSSALKRFDKRFGAAPIEHMTHEGLQEAIKPLEAFAQKTLLYALRHFVRWARATGELSTKVQDPTLGLELHKARHGKKTQRPWTPAEQARFERVWPIGTRERLAYEIMRRLGLRCHDAARFGPRHIVDGRIRFQPHKTRNSSKVWLDRGMDADLAEVIAATVPTGLVTYLVSDHGTPMSRHTIARLMRLARAKAGIPADAAQHGLRKTMMTDLVAAEATPHEIMAMSGHVTLSEIEGYTRAYDRRKAADRAEQKRRNSQ